MADQQRAAAAVLAAVLAAADQDVHQNSNRM